MMPTILMPLSRIGLFLLKGEITRGLGNPFLRQLHMVKTDAVHYMILSCRRIGLKFIAQEMDILYEQIYKIVHVDWL